MFSETIDTPIGKLTIQADDCQILAIRWGIFEKSRPNEMTRVCFSQLAEYFLGTRKEFDLPLALVGTEFQKLVWTELIKVEFAQTCSYFEIAERIDRPRAQRAVGGANHVNKFPIVIPCHRIIGKRNSLVGYALGLDKKAWLLTHERQNA